MDFTIILWCLMITQKSKVKSQKFNAKLKTILLFKVKMLFAKILDSSFASLESLVISFLSTSVASLSKCNQYFVSFADFKIIS